MGENIHGRILERAPPTNPGDYFDQDGDRQKGIKSRDILHTTARSEGKLLALPALLSIILVSRGYP